MTTLTQLKLCSSEQHEEMGTSRKKRDFDDLKCIQDWLCVHQPFDTLEPRLRSLSSGLIAGDNDGINCDQTEDIDAQIHNELDHKTLPDAKIKRSTKIKSIDSLYNRVKIDKTSINIKPTALFTRLIAVAQREQDVEKYFYYEMSPAPMSLFKDGMMRKPDKWLLRDAILTGEVEINSSAMHVIDGRGLLHRVRWSQNKCTYKDISMKYVKYVQNHYGKSHVVFDGYDDGPSTKDHEHLLRSYNNKGPGEVRIDDNTAVRCKQGDFLVYHWQPEMTDVTLKSDKAKKIWSIKECSESLIPGLKPYLLVLHAWCGCDTTSAICGKGKTSLLKKVTCCKMVQQSLDQIKDIWMDPAGVGKAGNQLFLNTYGEKKNERLSKLRYKKFLDMAAKGEMLPERLPPTERAAHYHSLRVHHQVIVWETLGDVVKDPLDWGWENNGTRLPPIMTDVEVAPSNLLKFIRCGCKSERKCESYSCSCRRHGLKCIYSCSGCRGESCANMETATQMIREISEDDGNIFQRLYETNV